MAKTSSADLIDALAAHWNVSRPTARARINAVVRTIIAKASRGPVTVHYLGRIYYAYRKAYSKRSPRGELEIIPAARILRLKPSKQLKHKAK